MNENICKNPVEDEQFFSNKKTRKLLRMIFFGAGLGILVGVAVYLIWYF